MRADLLGECGNHIAVAGLYPPIELQLVTEFARQHVTVEMLHRLLRAFPIRLDQIQSLGRNRHIDRPSDFANRSSDGDESLIANLEHGRIVVLRDNQTMAVMSGVDVHKGEGLVVPRELASACRSATTS
jgi:hypothetical protein